MQSSEPGGRTLASALFWRTGREGWLRLLFGFAPFCVTVGAITLLSLLRSGTINGGGGFATFAARYGATTNGVAVGQALLIYPGLVAVFAAVSVGLVVRNLVGSEASRGGIEALLAGPYRPGDIVNGFLLYVGTLATYYWAGMTLLGGGALVAVLLETGAHLSLGGAYVALILALPLLSAWAGAALSVFVALLYPRLTQQGQMGVAVNGSGLGGLATVIPALAVLFIFSFGAIRVRPSILLVVAGGATLAVIVGSVGVVSRRFRPDSILES